MSEIVLYYERRPYKTKIHKRKWLAVLASNNQFLAKAKTKKLALKKALEIFPDNFVINGIGVRRPNVTLINPA